MFIHSWSEGGAQRRTLALASALAARGHRIDLLVVRNEGPLRDVVPANVRVLTVGQWLAVLPRIRARRSRQVRAAIGPLAWYVWRERPQVLVSAANHTAIATARALRLSRREDVALVLRVSNALTSRIRSNAQVRDQAMREVLQRVDAVAALTQSLAAEVEALCSMPRPEIRVTVNPVLDARQLAAGHAAPGPASSDGSPLIVGVGRLTAQKDFATLLRAMALLPERHRPRVAVVGEGPEREKLLRLAEELRLKDRVEFPGRVTDPFTWLRRARLFVLSSRWEGLPGSLIEAMACGCPVVSTDTPGAREVLLNGELAPLVPCGNPSALARVVAEQLDHEIDTKPLRARAAAYTIDAAAEDFLRVLQAAIDTRRARMHR
ncbi:MAG TPA: glycosyltransferase [Nevskiaceae bacterium]|nr:glycosyltransferase [Nevskiaceae bacterium]